MSDALLIAAHGSRDESGISEFRAFAEAWNRLRPDRLQAAGFLEFARPTIGEAIETLVERGAKMITVVPAMLMAAGHVKNDVPSEIAEGRARHPGVTFHMARALDIHPALLELCHVRYREALADRPRRPRRSDAAAARRPGDVRPRRQRQHRPRLAVPLGVVRRRLGKRRVLGTGRAERRRGPHGLPAARRRPDRRPALLPLRRHPPEADLRDGRAARRRRPGCRDRSRRALPPASSVAPGVRGSRPRGLARRAPHELRPVQVPRPPDRPRGRPRRAAGGSPPSRPRPTGLEDDHDHDHRPRRSRRRSAPTEFATDPSFHPWDERLLRRLQLVQE